MIIYESVAAAAAAVHAGPDLCLCVSLASRSGEGRPRREKRGEERKRLITWLLTAALDPG